MSRRELVSFSHLRNNRMTKYSKILAVCVLFACLSFLGFAAASWSGGINWEAEADQLTDYEFERSAGETPTWSVKHRISQSNISVPHSRVLASAVVAAQKDMIQRHQRKSQELRSQLPPVEEELNNAASFVKTDNSAMKARQQKLQQALGVLTAATDQIAQQGIQKAQEVQAIHKQAANLREDVFRLQHQIIEMRSDRFLAEQQQLELRDLLTRVRGKIERLQRRQKQLKEMLN